MAQNANILIWQTAAVGGTQNGQIVLSPSRSRNGIYEYTGNTVNGEEGVISDEAFTKLTASVRPGTPADFSTGKARVKRRSSFKVALPISVPGPNGSSIIDYINVDFTLSNPIEATADQLRTALNSVHTAAYDGAASPLADLVVNGREPF